MAPHTIHTHVDARIVGTCLEDKMKILLDAGYQGYWGVEHHSAWNEYSEVASQLATVRRQLIRFANPPPPKA
jgi:sugar phosphate isomerase/epimerase